MPRARHRRTNPTRKSIAQLAKSDVAARIEKARKQRDAERKAARIPKGMERRADKATRAELAKHGYRTTKRGVLVDGPRDARSNPIKGSRVKVLRGGVVQTSVGERRDFIYGMTKAEKKRFAKNPEAMEKEIETRMRERFPLLRHVRKIQTRLQWGAYRATKDFAPSYFTSRYFSQLATHRPAKGKKRPKKIDTLTGFHFVVHVRRKKKNGKKKK